MGGWVSYRETEESLRTMEIPRIGGTVPQPVLTDADLDGASRTLTDGSPVRQGGSHRRPPRLVLTWPQTAVAAALAGAVAFGAFWVLTATRDSGPVAVRQAAPEATTVLRRPSPHPTRKGSAAPVAVAPARPAVIRSPAPVRTVEVTVTPTLTRTPSPSPSAPHQTHTATPHPTHTHTVPAAPDGPTTPTPVPDTETPHDDT